MPAWDPSPIWQGEVAYVIGGGPSLKRFDWDLLRGENTIGCNSAFILGADVVKINLFADYQWWKRIGRLQSCRYGGIMVGCTEGYYKRDLDCCDWLLTMERLFGVGLGTKTLGFNGNSGSLALNLALILGAQRVFLLGFDMKMAGGKPNWHSVRHEQAYESVYERFLLGFQAVVRDLPRKFPGREVYNVTDDSALNAFPKISMKDHFGGDPFLKGENT